MTGQPNPSFDKYLRKLGLLRDRATDPSVSEGERSVFAHRMHVLMQKYGIDASMLRAKDEGGSVPEEMVVEDIHCKGSYAIQLRDLACMIAEHTSGVHALISGRGTSQYAILCGYRSAVVSVEMVYASVHLQALQGIAPAWAQYAAENPRETKYYTARDRLVWRKSFLVSFTAALSRRMHEARSEALGDYSGSAALALVDRDAQAKAWAEAEYSPAAARRGRSPVTDESAYESGYAAGASARMTDTGEFVSRTRAITS